MNITHSNNLLQELSKRQKHWTDHAHAVKTQASEDVQRAIGFMH